MRRLLAIAALAVATACGFAPSQVVTGAPGHRDVLYPAEIETNRTPGMSAYDLITHLRPEYLRSRGPNSFSSTGPVTAVVYLDNARYGTLDSMKGINADIIEQAEYLSAASATTRYGLDHTGGAILLFTKSR